MARPGDPVAELDVLDRRPAVELGVEAAGLDEDVAADQAAAGPEGVGGAGVVDELARLVDVVVQEVPELADQPGGGGAVVVGAEEAGEAGVGLDRAMARAMASGWTATSASRKKIQGAVAARAPAFLAAAGPILDGLRTTRAPKDSASSAVPSVEPSSTTTSS